MFALKSMVSAMVVAGILCWPSDTRAQPVNVDYCASVNWMPYEGVRNNTHIGLIADYMQMLGELTGLTFTVVPTDNWQQSLEFLESGKCSMASMMDSAPLKRSELQQSLAVFDIPDVLVTRNDTPMLHGYGGIGSRRVGVVRDFRHNEFIARYYPAVELVPVSTEYLGYRALEQGDIDVMVGSLLSANAYLFKHHEQLKIAGVAEPFDALHFVFRAQPDFDLAELINGGISAIPESRRVGLFKRWNQVRVRHEQNLMPVVGLVLVTLIVIGLLFWRQRSISNITRRINAKTTEIESLQAILLEKNRTIEFLSNHDTVTGLYNRNHVILKAEEEISRFRRFQTPTSLVVMEILHTEAFTDAARGQTEEYLLRCLGRACLSSVREVDVIARWSNEQLVFLCPHTEQDEAGVLSQRLLACIEAASQEKGFTVTIAAGVAGLQDNWTFNDWYEQACSVLYQARRMGGGVVKLTYF